MPKTTLPINGGDLAEVQQWGADMRVLFERLRHLATHSLQACRIEAPADNSARTLDHHALAQRERFITRKIGEIERLVAEAEPTPLLMCDGVAHNARVIVNPHHWYSDPVEELLVDEFYWHYHPPYASNVGPWWDVQLVTGGELREHWATDLEAAADTTDQRPTYSFTRAFNLGAQPTIYADPNLYEAWLRLAIVELNNYCQRNEGLLLVQARYASANRLAEIIDHEISKLTLAIAHGVTDTNLVALEVGNPWLFDSLPPLRDHERTRREIAAENVYLHVEAVLTKRLHDYFRDLKMEMGLPISEPD